MKRIKNDEEAGWEDTATPWNLGTVQQLVDDDKETAKERKERLAKLKLRMPFIGFYPNE